jgi:hypothetical protein
MHPSAELNTDHNKMHCHRYSHHHSSGLTPLVPDFERFIAEVLSPSEASILDKNAVA